MRKNSILFLIVAAVSGIIGFAGFDFSGVEMVRIVFLIFADLLIVSLLARLFFPAPKVKMQRVEK